MKVKLCPVCLFEKNKNKNKKMKPGKRPGNKKTKPGGGGGFGGGGGGGGGASSYLFPKHWDTTKTSTKLQRCILTHDVFHILNWHTPAYSLFVYLSVVIVILGASSYPSLLHYLVALVSAAVMIGGIAKKLEVESGLNAVISPLELKVRTRTVVDFNVKNLYSRCVEPLFDSFLNTTTTTTTSSPTSLCSMGKKFFESVVYPKNKQDLQAVAVLFLVISIVAEFAQSGREYLTFSGVVTFFVTVLFVMGGVQRLTK